MTPPGRSGVALLKFNVRLSKPAAVFLHATVRHMNHAKTLPDDESAALTTSGWLEEIEAAVSGALDESVHQDRLGLLEREDVGALDGRLEGVARMTLPGEACETCHGTGARPSMRGVRPDDPHPYACPECAGTGKGPQSLVAAYQGAIEVLKFYADRGNYVPAGIAPTIWHDNGQRARAALAQRWPS